MNYYERHIGDYARDAGHLSLAEHGAYTLLLDRIYASEAPIAESIVYRVCRARTAHEKAAVDAVLDEFFVLTGDGWVNSRCDAEIKLAKARIEAARSNGKKGGRKKANEINDAANPAGTQEVVGQAPQPKAHHLPPNHLPISSPKGEEALARTRKQPSRPDAVSEQTWSDWLSLRKSKKAPVTETVVKSATAEAEKAGMDLEAFLALWCSLGYQGLKAEWIVQHRGSTQASEPEWRREQRERMTKLAGPAAAKPSKPFDFVDMEDADADALRLG